MHIRKFISPINWNAWFCSCATQQCSTISVDSCGITSSSPVSLAEMHDGKSSSGQNLSSSGFGCSCCSMRKLSRDKKLWRSIERKLLQWVGQIDSELNRLRSYKIRKWEKIGNSVHLTLRAGTEWKKKGAIPVDYVIKNQDLYTEADL